MTTSCEFRCEFLFTATNNISKEHFQDSSQSTVSVMLHSMLLGPAHGAVSVLGFPLSGTNPSHPSPSSPLTRLLYPPFKLRFLTHGWPSTLPLPVYNLTPTEPAYPPTTPSPLSSIHYWMVRSFPLLIHPVLPNLPPMIHFSLSTRPASSLHPYSTSNLHTKYRRLSPPLSHPSPF